MGNIASDSFRVTGNLATNGASVNISNIDAISSGLMRELFSYGSASNTSLNIGTTPSSTSASDFTITNNSNAKKIYVNANASVINDTVLRFWNPASATQAMGSGGNGTWSATGNTWTNQAGSLAAGELDPAASLAIFAGNAGAAAVMAAARCRQRSAIPEQLHVERRHHQPDSGTTGQTYISTGGSVSSGNQVTIDSILSGSHGINKVDGGTLILSGTNTYTGGTIVSGGELQGDTISIRGDVVVAAGATVNYNQSNGGGSGATPSAVLAGWLKPVRVNWHCGANSYTGGTVVSLAAQRRHQ